ncbi:MAG: beta-propeller fold lactonase family protein [Pyrinomonadaceae bacterium]
MLIFNVGIALITSTRAGFYRFNLSRIGALGALAFPRTASSRRQPRERNLYVGTYTTGKSEGIYCYRMDTTSGAMKSFGSIKADNPSFLAVDVPIT